MDNKKCKRVMKGHSRGVVTIEYSHSQRIIVSAGFDHDIVVWSPVAGQVRIRRMCSQRNGFFIGRLRTTPVCVFSEVEVYFPRERRVVMLEEHGAMVLSKGPLLFTSKTG